MSGVNELEDVFFTMNHIEDNDEFPEGLIVALNRGLVRHTSMCVEDVAEIDNKFYVVDVVGWKKL